MVQILGSTSVEVPAGFAHQVAAIRSGLLLGDVNLDNEVTFADIATFIALLTSGDYQAEADVDQNGEVNFLDIGRFIAVLTSQ